MRAWILEGDHLRTTSSLEDIRAAIAEKRVTWVDLEKQSDDASALLVGLGIHALTIEDIWNNHSQPKLEDYDNYLYVIVHGIRGTKKPGLDLTELEASGVIETRGRAGSFVTGDEVGRSAKEAAAAYAARARALGLAPDEALALVARALGSDGVPRSGSSR